MVVPPAPTFAHLVGCSDGLAEPQPRYDSKSRPREPAASCPPTPGTDSGAYSFLCGKSWREDVTAQVPPVHKGGDGGHPPLSVMRSGAV